MTKVLFGEDLRFEMRYEGVIVLKLFTCKERNLFRHLPELVLDLCVQLFQLLFDGFLTLRWRLALCQ